MKSLDRIPTGKVQRASKLVATGAKVGVNYLKYYGDKLTGQEEARDRLDRNNAEDIYNSLSEMKGSALKVAQMLSMDRSILPEAYVDQFSLAQFSVPSLSAPLVHKTFRKYFGVSPQQLFDHFEPEAVHAASIGQVHRAKKDGKTLAVKIQYPGVADSIQSDLALVRPIAYRMLNIKGKDADRYFVEVEQKLLEETDYRLELAQSQAIAEACKELEGVRFPSYYQDLSSERVLTMDWMDGMHLGEFVDSDADQEAREKVGQILWNFYMYQVHHLKKVHADPHPGNFLVNSELELVVLDFGCMKAIPDEFYEPYFELTLPGALEDEDRYTRLLERLEILRDDDGPEERRFFKELFREMLGLFTQPLQSETFDFSDKQFFQDIATMGERFSKSSELRNMNANRGSKHFIYMNRTFFGLYQLMHQIGAKEVQVLKMMQELAV